MNFVIPIDSQLGIGFTTRCTLNRLVEDGCVSPEAVKKFHGGARNFFRRSVEYARAKLPLNDEVLRNSKFVDFNQKMDVSVECVQYFTERYLFVVIISEDELSEH